MNCLLQPLFLVYFAFFPVVLHLALTIELAARVSSSISLPPKPTTKRWEGSHSGPFPASPSSLHLKPPTISKLHSLHDNPHLLTCYNFQTSLSWVTWATRV